MQKYFKSILLTAIVSDSLEEKLILAWLCLFNFRFLSTSKFTQKCHLNTREYHLLYNLLQRCFYKFQLFCLFSVAWNSQKVIFLKRCKYKRKSIHQRKEIGKVGSRPLSTLESQEICHIPIWRRKLNTWCKKVPVQEMCTQFSIKVKLTFVCKNLSG